MADKKDLQALYDAAHHHADQARAVQNNIKRLTSAKKDSDVKQYQNSLVHLLNELNDDLKELQSKSSIVQRGIESSTHKPKEDEKPQTNDKSDPNQQTATKEEKPQKKSRPTNPEDQEVAYQLKARLMPQLLAQNTNLQDELLLRSRCNELRNQRKERQINYNRVTNLSAATCLQVISLHERRAREADARARALQEELDQLKGKQGVGQNNRQTAKSADGDRANSQSRTYDADKRNQLLMKENEDQSREIQRLKRDNAELLKKAKHAEQDKNQNMSHLSTSEMARRDLHSRLQRQKAQYDQLSRTLTRQSTEWIEGKKQREQGEEEYRWKNVAYAAPHGAHERTYAHPVPRNTDRPRNMYPVHKYAQSSAA